MHFNLETMPSKTNDKYIIIQYIHVIIFKNFLGGSLIAALLICLAGQSGKIKYPIYPPGTLG